ncbi:hypothetical protein [Bacillus licheniformis]|uniref:hypothetical protein n=1 Tax=Bacillus licheniformis TaxID=1402 RepID=UPI003F9FD3C1
MTKTNEKIHVLADESLGGIKREYVEVNRKAKLGEKIVIVDPGYGDHYSNGDFFTVELYTGYGSGVATKCGHHVGNNEYCTLEPTNVVHIDGERYEMVERKAEVCEKVIHLNNDKSGGRVREVTNVGVGTIDVIEYEHPDGDITCGFSHGCYRVLVPLSKENEYQEFEDKKRGYKEVKNFYT